MRFRCAVLFAGVLLATAAIGRSEDSQIAQAADQPKIFRVEPHWTKGDVFHFSVIKTEKKERAGKPPSTGKISYDVEMRVLESRADGYTILWQDSNINMLEPVDPTGEADKLAAANEIALRLSTDASGLPSKIENWDEVKTNLLKGYDAFLLSKPEQTRKTMHDSFADLLGNPKYESMLRASTLSDPAIFYMLCGIEFQNPPQIKEAKLPSPLGNVDLPAKATWALVEESGTNVKVREQITCGPDAGAIIAKVLKKMDEDAGRKSDVPEKIKLEMVITADATFVKGNALPTTLRYERKTKVDGDQDVVTMEIDQVANPAISGPTSRP